MRVENFKCEKNIKLSKFLLEKNIQYNDVFKLIRNKDIKINEKRIGKDCNLVCGDKVSVFLPNENKVKIVFEDDNIVVAKKNRNIETINEQGDDFVSKVSDELKQSLYAVHRLDRNTEGLVVFAKNFKAKESLDNAFKNRLLEKYYLALVFGEFDIKEQSLCAFLKKDKINSVVKISDKQTSGYEKIITKYKVLEQKENLSLIEVELVTGKTHQIRAHMSHIGHFVIGDEKYGDSNINKIYKKHFQCLCAYRIVFHFPSGDYLEYLNNKEIKLDKNTIDFCQNF